jgi:hypothetical protein
MKYLNLTGLTYFWSKIKDLLYTHSLARDVHFMPNPLIVNSYNNTDIRLDSQYSTEIAGGLIYVCIQFTTLIDIPSYSLLQTVLFDISEYVAYKDDCNPFKAQGLCHFTYTEEDGRTDYNYLLHAFVEPKGDTSHPQAEFYLRNLGSPIKAGEQITISGTFNYTYN